MTYSNKAHLLRSSILAGVIAAGFVAAAPAALTGAAAHAQDYTTGAITGTVVDANGDAVAGADVAIRSVAQGFSRSTTSAADGDIRFGLLPQGEYEVVVSAPGFRSTESVVSVRAGSESAYRFDLVGASEVITVTGTATQVLDFAQTTTGLDLDIDEVLETLPINRNITAVSRLAPTVTRGDADFGNLANIGGASVAENAFYVNGLNITNLDNFLGAALVPFEFYQSVEVKNGGIPAEYGRSPGGIINAVTESGTNEWTFEVHANYAPDALRADETDIVTEGTRTQGDLFERESSSLILEGGGPIIRDRLFVYGLTEFRDSTRTTNNAAAGLWTEYESDDPFYGVKVDGYITDDHRLEFTWWDTTRETNVNIFDFDATTGDVSSAPNSNLLQTRGGEAYVARYTGNINDWLTLSAAYGEVDESYLDISGDTSTPYIVNVSGTTIGGVASGGLLGTQSVVNDTSEYETSRTFFRADADLYFDFLGEHHLRIGFEREETFLARNTQRNGGYAIVYRQGSASNSLGVPAGTTYAEFNVFTTGGAFEGENDALYIQDSWDVSDRLNLQLGLRSDSFLQLNAAGDPLVDQPDNLAARLGFNYDPTGEGRQRFFGSYGRNYFPIAANTAFRGGASELAYREYWLFSGVDAGGNPLLTTQITEATNPTGTFAICPAGVFGSAGTRGCAVTGDGEANPAETFASLNVETGYADEYILGYEHTFDDLWSAQAIFRYRELLQAAEDISIDFGVQAYCAANGLEMTNAAGTGCADVYSGFHQYLLSNPGSSVEAILIDPLSDGTTRLTLSADGLGYPDPERKFMALELNFTRQFDGLWGLRGSYVLSEAIGNYGGFVNADLGQDDAGVTQDFDNPGIMDGARGLLPSHRAHQFKLFGSYQATEDLLVGFNAELTSPRRFGCLGNHPTEGQRFDASVYESLNAFYGPASWFCQGESTPRGSQFSSDWEKNFDVSLRYSVDTPLAQDMVLRADIFNLFNFQSVVDAEETGDRSDGNPDPDYQLPTQYQTPRFVRLGFDLRF
ncbi:carboxypeptidase regulatory-like domain-containing protein [Maricaulis sp.]|uniref:TonB-dependent receptor n=1 Tax=Maricaulis sp. TaxID=1486257 RepID=UPI002622DE45|nr:carboxypeptidase regulatory-like domain-containing protein [Maricaulis sp.]